MLLIGATNEQKIEIYKEINETTETKLEVNKAIIKQWLNTQPHLPHNYDERILASFIRGCKHDLEKVKQKLDCYFTSRTLMPDLLCQRDPTTPELRTVTNSFIVFPLPRLTPDGARVTYHQITDEDPAKMDVKSIMKLLMAIGDIRIIEEGPISGDIYVFDAKYVKPNYIPKIFNPTIKKGIMYSQNALPQRLKEIHIINCPPFADAALNFVKMFVKQKIKERFHVHSDTESLFSHIPQEFLPSDFGGKEKSIEDLQEDWWKKLDSYSSYFEKQETVCSDESKRNIGSACGANEYDGMYGTVGSFHKLNID